MLYGVMVEMLFMTIHHSIRLLALHAVMKIGNPISSEIKNKL